MSDIFGGRSFDEPGKNLDRIKSWNRVFCRCSSCNELHVMPPGFEHYYTPHGNEDNPFPPLYMCGEFEAVDKIDRFDGDFCFLSNFYNHPVYLTDIKFGTAEHAYQALKANSVEDFDFVRLQETPGKAKRAGRKIELRPDWEDVKDSVMLQVVRAKFADPQLCKLLLQTGDAELVEGNHWGDTVWGVCNGKGENRLGKILMQVRDELR